MDNPFAQPSQLPFELPPFDRIRTAHYRDAFEAGMRAQLKEIAAITQDSAPPDFDSTIVALERSGSMLERVAAVFFNLNASNTDPEMQQIDCEMAPRLAAHEDAILLDPALYARVEALYERRANLSLDAESLELLIRHRTQFVRAGARLAGPEQQRLRALNERISSLTTQFKQNVLRATQEAAVVVDGASELDGLSAEQIGAAQSAAAARGLGGKWLIPLHNTTNQPALAQLKSRPLRERIYRASINRGRGGTADNTPVVAELVRLRAERAALLGYPTHAAYQLEDESAGNPRAVHDILTRLAPVALERAKADAGQMQALLVQQAEREHSPAFELQPWDWPFYAEQLRRARYRFDQAQIMPYFELDGVLRDGVFYAAERLYGLSFEERTDLPRYHPDVRVFEVRDSNDAPLALFLADYFARDNKQGGAWMCSYVRQSTLLCAKAVVANNLNIPKPQRGQPVLLTFEEVTAMFHEFGHALHGLLSNVRYPLLSGTNVPRDFVEYPSQYNEMWARDPAVVAHFAKHYQSGAAMPPELLAKVLAANKFDQGYATTEYLAAAMLDQAWHGIAVSEAPTPERVVDFEAAALERSGLQHPSIPPRYHSTYFSHVFAGGYSAGYYAYLWSEILARDTGQWFHERGGLTRANGDCLRAKVLSRGRSEDPQSLFRNFYGGPPDIGPLLEYRGLN
jgi:peptidyl-dipeptidase Dcp